MKLLYRWRAESQQAGVGAFPGQGHLADDVRSFSAQLRIAADGPAVFERLLDLLSTTAVGGKQIHDANIVATMQVHGITRLLTHNVGDFRRFAAEIVLVPLA